MGSLAQAIMHKVASAICSLKHLVDFFPTHVAEADPGTIDDRNRKHRAEWRTNCT